MKNFVQVGDVLTLVAPAGGVTSGQLVKIGSLNVVAAYAAAAGDEFEGHTCGVFEVPKLAADAYSAGDVAVLDAANSQIDAAGVDGNVGIVIEDAAASSVTCKVKLVAGIA